MKQIVFNNVSKKYISNITAIKDISFSIDAGEFIFITGPSGAGKSTLLRLLIKQEIPTSGEIFFEKIPVSTIPPIMVPLYRQRIGMVFQDLKLIQNKTAEENIEFALEIGINKNYTRQKKNEIIDYLFDLVNLQERRSLFPAQLSGGEKQKVAIARALANNPKVIAADEPTGNLDTESAEEIINILRKINNTGTTVLIISHDMNIVQATKARNIQIKNGELVSDTKSKKSKNRIDKKSSTIDISKLNLKTDITNKLRLIDLDSIEDILDETPKTLEEKGLKPKEVKLILKKINLFFKQNKI